MTVTLTPLILGLGVQELVIILVILLLLFGGSRLAGLGKSSGRALKEFKEETRGLRDPEKDADQSRPPAAPQQPQVTNGQVGPTGQDLSQPPNYQQASTPQPPNNLADPAAPDVRRDV